MSGVERTPIVATSFDTRAMATTHTQLVGALLKGMRRAEYARAASVAYAAGMADQMNSGFGTLDDAGKVLEMFGLDAEQIQELGLIGVEELGRRCSMPGRSMPAKWSASGSGFARHGSNSSASTATS